MKKVLLHIYFIFFENIIDKSNDNICKLYKLFIKIGELKIM